MGINFCPAFLSDAFAASPEDSALMDEAERVEAAFIADPASREKTEAWHRMQDRLMQMWRPGVKEIVDHIDHAVRWAGLDHVGIGTDFDGIEVTPEGLEDVSKLPIIFDLLRRKGYSEDKIEKIAGQNFLRVFNDVISNSL